MEHEDPANILLQFKASKKVSDVDGKYLPSINNAWIAQQMAAQKAAQKAQQQKAQQEAQEKATASAIASKGWQAVENVKEYSETPGWPLQHPVLFDTPRDHCGTKGSQVMDHLKDRSFLDFLTTLAPGDGYFYDPTYNGGRCTRIPAGQVLAVKRAKLFNRWQDSNTAITYLPPLVLAAPDKKRDGGLCPHGYVPKGQTWRQGLYRVAEGGDPTWCIDNYRELENYCDSIPGTHIHKHPTKFGRHQFDEQIEECKLACDSDKSCMAFSFYYKPPEDYYDHSHNCRLVIKSGWRAFVFDEVLPDKTIKISSATSSKEAGCFVKQNACNFYQIKKEAGTRFVVAQEGCAQ